MSTTTKCIFLLLLPIVHGAPLQRRSSGDSAPTINASGLIGLCTILFFCALLVGMLVIARNSRKKNKFGPTTPAVLITTTTTIQPPPSIYSRRRENPRGARAVYRVPTVGDELPPPPPTYQEARSGAGKDGGRVATMEVATMDINRPSYQEAIGNGRRT
jgi:hypothetical protein